MCESEKSIAWIFAHTLTIASSPTTMTTTELYRSYWDRGENDLFVSFFHQSSNDKEKIPVISLHHIHLYFIVDSMSDKMSIILAQINHTFRNTSIHSFIHTSYLSMWCQVLNSKRKRKRKWNDSVELNGIRKRHIIAINVFRFE